MSKTILIYYQGGAYGTFIEWLLTYLTDTNIDGQLPFSRFGNSHKFEGNRINKNPSSLEQVTTANNVKFARTHTGTISIEQISSLFSSVIQINVPFTSKFWINRNGFEKFDIVDLDEKEISYFKEYDQESFFWIKNYTDANKELRTPRLFATYFTQEQLTSYNVANIDDLKRWQLREIFSFWEINSVMCHKLSEQSDNVYNINVEDLRYRMPSVIDEIIQKLQLNVIPDRYAKIDWIWQEWTSRQYDMDRDQIVKEYIDNVINCIDRTESKTFTILEEAEIQQKLRESGYEIKCDGLEYLPLRTIDLKELLYNV